MHPHMHTRMHTHAHMHTRIHTCTHAHTHTRTAGKTGVRVDVWVRGWVCMGGGGHKGAQRAGQGQRGIARGRADREPGRKGWWGNRGRWNDAGGGGDAGFGKRVLANDWMHRCPWPVRRQHGGVGVVGLPLGLKHAPNNRSRCSAP
jgi:hypothetical protein